MRFSLNRVFVLLFAVALVSSVQAQVPSDAQIAGRVVRADNGAPIGGAILHLYFGMGAGGNPQTVKTDSNGDYYLQGLKAGSYTIMASADGFVTAEYRKDASLLGGMLKVDATARMRGVDLRLIREAVIRGVVIDDAGKPVGSGVFVAAVGRDTRAVGSKGLSPVSTGYTNATGHFALKKLLAGNYFVCVDGPSGYEAHPDPGGWYEESWYGGKPSEKGALQVSLKEGGKRDGIQINVKREKRYRIIVWPKGPQGESPTDSYDFDLLQRDAWEVKHTDGSYIIPNIPPGHYTLTIHAVSGGYYVAQTEKHFDVVDRDVTLRIDVDGAVDNKKSEMKR
jgi:hypothetical protein